LSLLLWLSVPIPGVATAGQAVTIAFTPGVDTQYCRPHHGSLRKYLFFRNDNKTNWRATHVEQL